MKDPAVFVQQLREVADWYEAHPEAPLPHQEAFDVRLYGVHSKEDAANLIRLFGTCAKDWSASFLCVVKLLPSGAKITGVFDRSRVCTRKVVGTRIVPKQVTAEHIQEIVEWNCDPLLKEAEQEPAHDPA